jgi:hypothetical protein
VFLSGTFLVCLAIIIIIIFITIIMSSFSSFSHNTENIWESQHKFIRWHVKKENTKQTKGSHILLLLALSLSAICLTTAARTATSGLVFLRLLVEFSKAAGVSRVSPSQVRLQNPNFNIVFSVIFTTSNYQ